MSVHRSTRPRARLGTRRGITALAAGLVMVAAGLLGIGQAAAETTGPEDETDHRDYVALGDSYAAGTGTGAYDPNSGECLRGPLAYPRLWADSRGATSFDSEACANAVTWQVEYEQTKALSDGTDYVTVMVGGNDVGFSSVLEACRSPLSTEQACLARIADARGFIGTELAPRLDRVYAAIRRMAPHATVVVVGYPRLFTERSFCGLLSMSNLVRHQLNLTADQLAELTRNTATRIRSGAVRKNFVFADPRPDFAAHGLCGPDVWINGVNVLQVMESYHPNQAGQRYGLLPAVTRVIG